MADQIMIPQTRITLNDAHGTPIAGGTVTFYRSGTTTLAEIYADDAMTTPLPNPLMADSTGRLVQVFFGGGYEVKAVIRRDDGALVETLDPCPRWSSSNAAAAGITANPYAGDGLTLSGEDVQTQLEELADGVMPANAELGALAGVSGTGIMVRAGAEDYRTRTIVAGDGVLVSNGNGVTENPSVAADFATQGQAQTGTSTTKVMSPFRVRQAFSAGGTAPMFAVRAWARFVVIGGVLTISHSGNIADIVRNAEGHYTITFTEAMSHGGYAISAVGETTNFPVFYVENRSSTGFDLRVGDRGSGTIDTSGSLTVVC